MAVIQSMSDRDGLIWFDKKMTPWREAQTHVLTHTLMPQIVSAQRPRVRQVTRATGWKMVCHGEDCWVPAKENA